MKTPTPAFLIALTLSTASCTPTTQSSNTISPTPLITSINSIPPKTKNTTTCWLYNFNINNMKHTHSICNAKTINRLTQIHGQNHANKIKKFIDTTTFNILITDTINKQKFTTRSKPQVQLNSTNHFKSDIANLTISKIKIAKHFNIPSNTKLPNSKTIHISFDYKITVKKTKNKPTTKSVVGSSSFYLRINEKNKTSQN